MFIPVRKATVLLPSASESDPNLRHLFILLTNPIGEANEIAMVSLSTVREGKHHDKTCLLFPGDHPFIRENSYVVYSRARIEESQKIIRGVQDGVLMPRARMKSEIFARVYNGLYESRLTEPRIKAFCKQTY